MSKKLKALLEKAQDLRPNFEYRYYDPSEGELEYGYKVYKNKQLIRLPFSVENDEMKFNYVTFDTDEKTAEGHCTFIEPYQCMHGHGPFKLDYAEWYKSTPQDWIMDISYAEITSDGFVQGRLTKVIEFEEDNHTYRMNLDAFYGLPLRVEIDPEEDDAGVVHDFSEIIVSSLDKEDVEPPLPRLR